jgi:uncharacterized membrane protein YidH (DUF202 family)
MTLPKGYKKPPEDNNHEYDYKKNERTDLGIKLSSLSILSVVCGILAIILFSVAIYQTFQSTPGSQASANSYSTGGIVMLAISLILAALSKRKWGIESWLGLIGLIVALAITVFTV